MLEGRWGPNETVDVDYRDGRFSFGVDDEAGAGGPGAAGGRGGKGGGSGKAGKAATGDPVTDPLFSNRGKTIYEG